MKAKVLLRTIGIVVLLVALTFTVYGFIKENKDKEKQMADATPQTESKDSGVSTAEPEPTAAPMTETTAKPSESALPQDGDEQVTYKLTVKEGSTADEIAVELESNGIIKSASEFKEVMQNRSLTTNIHVGTYEVNNNMTYEQIMKTLTGNSGNK